MRLVCAGLVALVAWWSLAAKVAPDLYPRRSYTGPPVRLTVLTTNDLHSTADGCCGPDSAPERKRGGYDRLLHTIERVRAERERDGGLVLTLDAGDWYSGTLFSKLGPLSSSVSEEAPELAYFSAARYDAVALGNHDFDAGVPGLRRMLAKHRRVAVLCANLAATDELEAAVAPFVIKELPLPAGAAGGSSGVLRVGIFALMGVDAAFASSGNRGGQAAHPGYDDAAGLRLPAALHARASDVVAELRGGAQRCDIVVCLLHGGRDAAADGAAGGEDGELARAVAGIDVVVAGHTHERYMRTLVRGGTAAAAATETHVMQCGSEGAALGVAEFELTAARGLALHGAGGGGGGGGAGVAAGGWLEHGDGHCLDINASTSAGDAAMARRVAAWRAAAGEALGLDVNELVYNGTARGAGALLRSGMGGRAVSIALAGAVRDQANAELRRLAAADDASAAAAADAGHASVSALLGSARGRDGAPLQLAAYISCVDCVRSDVYEVGGRVPLRASDVMRAMGITGGRPLSLFYLAKADLLAAVDLVDLLYRYVSPLFGITVSPNVAYGLRGWGGVPFVNRVANFSIDGVPFDELPDRLLVGANGYIAPFFWRSAQLSRGAMASMPLDAAGARLPVGAVASTFATGLPVEYELLVRFLQRQPQ
jgi:hypothetical protein